MEQPYLQCLKDHDVPIRKVGRLTKGPGGEAMTNPEPDLLDNPVAYNVDPSTYPGADEACDALRPIPAPELDPKTNPDYMNDFRAQMDCMREKGLDVDPNADGSGYRLPEYNARTEKISDECQNKAFGGRG